MDASDVDADTKLYKASSELLQELQAKVPRLVLDSKNQRIYRKWVIKSKVHEVTHLLDRFQEWPQLLDPYLSNLTKVLVDAYLWYCVSHPKEFLRGHGLASEVESLPEAVSHVLYAFCKVRGYKVIVRLLNNEPKYVEPMLSCFRLWTSSSKSTSDTVIPTMTWEGRYIHLLWLSHLLLAPFELSTISVLSVDSSAEQLFPELYHGLPAVSINLAMAGIDHLYLPSKAREAASTLLVRLSLRTDMQRLGLPARLVNWTVTELATPSNKPDSTGYRQIGLLSLLFGLMNLATDAESAPLLSKVFNIVYTATTSNEKHFKSIRSFAPARKLLVKIMRSTVIHALALDNSKVFSDNTLDLNTMLEDCIQTLLDLTADRDTPVRMATSKALSLICLRIDAAMSAEVVDAVIDSLNENVLLEDTASGRLFPLTDIPRDASVTYKKNVNAVDPLRWHGCMLTLGNLLFRRSLPESQLSAVIEILLMGLNFEQRSSVGTSVGVGVRDAACFGIWSLARKYPTTVLNGVSIPDTLIPAGITFSGATGSSTLQLVATHLAMSACLDPSGNLRRGSSAALQELIGRHPDVIDQGIPVVQTIDYHAVARRSRAVTEVAIEASKLSPHYHGSLLYALLGWRGARATDADSRRQAAQSCELLIAMTQPLDTLSFLKKLVSEIKDLKLSNLGSNAASRHGLLSCLASTIRALPHYHMSHDAAEFFSLLEPELSDVGSIIGPIDGRMTVDLENVLDSTSQLLEAYARYLFRVSNEKQNFDALSCSRWATSILPILDRCTTASDKFIVANSAVEASIAILPLLSVEGRQDLVSLWLDPSRQNKADIVCRGRIATLASVYEILRTQLKLSHLQPQIVAYVSNIIKSPYSIETKCYAMEAINTMLRNDLDDESTATLIAAIHIGLADYTLDQRGDIGSLLRIVSIEAARQSLRHHTDMSQNRPSIELLVKLAAERLIKVRFQAWKCLEFASKQAGVLLRTFDHQADVSSFTYFQNLIEYLHQQPQFHEALFTGLMSTISQGTEESSRAASEALVWYLHQQNIDDQNFLIESIFRSIARYKTSIVGQDDREVIPAIDFLTLIVEQVLSAQSRDGRKGISDTIWPLCQSLTNPSSSIVRIEALVRLYGALAQFESCHVKALDKLTRLLLHRWPKIRTAAADTVFLSTSAESIVNVDWNASVALIKPKVLSLRKELSIAGIT